LWRSFLLQVPQHMERPRRAWRKSLGFDGVDINMGCPADTIVWQGAGANLIKNPPLALELIAAAKQGAPDLPVSVKTRLGYNQDELGVMGARAFIGKPVALTLHARTKKEMSKVPAHWERVKRAVEIRNEAGSSTLIVGNGDLKDIEDDAKEKIQESGADGGMLGRAIFGRPWLFSNSPELKNIDERFALRLQSSTPSCLRTCSAISRALPS
jgi:tRNA-dihydrouridine synthase